MVGGLVQMHLECEPGLRRPVPPLRTARRLVCKSPGPFEPVIRDPVGRRLQGARIVRARHAIAAESTAVQGRAQMLRGHGAILRETGLQVHQHRVAAAMAVEDFLAGQRRLARPPESQRQLGDHHLVAEGIALAAESAAIRAGDHADSRRRQTQHLRQRAVHVVRSLRGRVHGYPAGILGHADRTVLFHGQMRIALEVAGVLQDDVRLFKALLHGAELERDLLVDIAFVSVVVNLRFRRRQRLVEVRDCGQGFVLHLDSKRGGVGNVLGHCGDGRDRIAHEAHGFHGERVLIL